MPWMIAAVVGIFLGWSVFTLIWTVLGPIVALLNFLVGRFLIASGLMAFSLFCATFTLDDFKVGQEQYEVLLALGLVLEAVKWGGKLWWQIRKENEASPLAGYDIVINIVDEDDAPPMKDVTPRKKALSSRFR